MLFVVCVGDWDLLVVLEVQCGKYIVSLCDSEENIILFELLCYCKVDIIKKILEDDCDICNFIELGLCKLLVLIQSNQIEQKFFNIYGMGS